MCRRIWFPFEEAVSVKCSLPHGHFAAGPGSRVEIVLGRVLNRKPGRKGDLAPTNRHAGSPWPSQRIGAVVASLWNSTVSVAVPLWLV